MLRDLASRDIRIKFILNYLYFVVLYTWLVCVTEVLIETLAMLSEELRHLDLKIIFGFDLYKVGCTIVLFLCVSLYFKYLLWDYLNMFDMYMYATPGYLYKNLMCEKINQLVYTWYLVSVYNY